MFAKPFLKTSLALAAACTLWAGSAQADVHTLNLTGVVGNGATFGFDAIGSHFDFYQLVLQGLDGSNAIAVNVGDTINATVTLDEALLVPASIDFTSIGLTLQGSMFPAVNTATTSTVSFFTGATLVKTYTGSLTTSSQIAGDANFAPPDNGAFSFDKFTASILITDLIEPGTLDSSQFLYALASPLAVPEPATWAMMIVGFGGVGVLMRRNRRDRGLTAFA